MANKAKICPVIDGAMPYLLKVTRLILTAFSMSSIEIRTITVFFFVNAPYKPMQNKISAKARKAEAGTELIPHPPPSSYHFSLRQSNRLEPLKAIQMLTQ